MSLRDVGSIETTTIDVDGEAVPIWRLDQLGVDLDRLPYSVKVLLENQLRNLATGTAEPEHVRLLAEWDPAGGSGRDVPFSPVRVLMQDFTGVPAIVDLAAMRDAVAEMGGDPLAVNPSIPVDLVVDHSIVADVARVPDAFVTNARLETERNRERYSFLKWGAQAFRNLSVLPPNTGICHQVNLEHLSRVVERGPDGVARPDTLVGTDSHTPMVNGLGVLGWGVGGIEAEAAMLGEPISVPVPEVVGFELTGSLDEGATATDLVLTITERLRQVGVVGRFVEFFGEGVATIPLENRATIGNMSPEYGATCAIFPIDAETLRYLRFTGRSAEHVALVEAYAKEQRLWHEPSVHPQFTETIRLDLSTVVPSVAGPSRPQDRIPIDRLPDEFCEHLDEYLHRRAERRVRLASHTPGVPSNLLPPGVREGSTDAMSVESFPASDPPGTMPSPTTPADAADLPAHGVPVERGPHEPTAVQLADGTSFEIDHGSVVLAAITSCTNTSNPSVMVAAGLLARKARERGLTVPPWVKTTLAPGSKVVTDYYRRAGLDEDLGALGFHLVGYGCTTCIGNSGPLQPEISEAIDRAQLAVASVLSGNRNFEGRIHPEVRMNFLASPPLVVAYALAGTMEIDLTNDPLGTDPDGNPVRLRDIWPSPHEVQQVIDASLDPEMFARRYSPEEQLGDEIWQALEAPSGDRMAWPEGSTYIRRPSFLVDIPTEPAPPADIRGARVLALLGGSVTTDHISPAGVIAPDSPAGRWLSERGVQPTDFNSYGSRRGNHEVMVRGTFANPRIRNELAPGTEGGVTTHLTSGEVMPIYDAAQRYREEGTPLIVLAGKEYGSGSSRDWAAKGSLLLGIKAVIAESFERIHRSNLVDMGILPLQFRDGESVSSLGLTGHETYEVVGLDGISGWPVPEELTVRADDREFQVRLRIDAPAEAGYWLNGGILDAVVRDLARK